MRMHNPPHPGEVLGEMWLEPMGLSVTDAATWLKLSRKTLSEILNGRAPVTLETAVRFELATGKSAQSWLGHQAAFDDWHAAELRLTLAVRPWEAALQHRAAMEADLAPFMNAQGLKASWHQGDKLLRLQAVRGGTTQAPIVVTFPDDFWTAYAGLGKRDQKDARTNVVSQVETLYDPAYTGQYAQEVTADPSAAFELDA
ncbi:HigA family addiction module antitoxin [Rhodoferax sp.]|uniref:HigA family addiction module antitoxin n=1 Tax=Rhodoferax sp. TaxID=50421 RepID=UPI00274BD618|nr:HigA family addiction module antitoxin [Rhodoferax sp.]